MEKKDINKEESLILIEANIANDMMLDGLTGLRKANNFEIEKYYKSFFLLSIGIERLLKLILIYEYKKKNDGKLPSNKILKDSGHNIKKMIKTSCPNLLDKYIYNIVIEFITDFAKNTRYYNLDILTGKELEADPISVWNIIEGIILKTYNAKIPVIQNNQILKNMIKEFTDMHITLSDGTTTDNIEPLLFEIETKDIIQGYNVLVFYEIIQSLVEILVDYQGNNTYPDMREIFRIFLASYTKSEIRNKKNWKKI